MKENTAWNTDKLDLSMESMQKEVISWGERLLQPNPPKAVQEHLADVAGTLISIYSPPWRERELRERAASVVAQLGARYAVVVQLLIEDAERYISYMEVDDSDPISPNAFDVLAKVRPVDDRVLSFLRAVARRESGFSATHAAADALATLKALAA